MFFIFKPLFQMPARSVLWVVFLVTMGLILGSFYIEHVLEEMPCKMCWWQRYVHWFIFAVAATGLLIRKIPATRFIIVVLLGSAIGFLIALYQSFGQLGWLELPASCTGNLVGNVDGDDLLKMLQNPQKIPDCSSTGFKILGLTLAGWNSISMFLYGMSIVVWLKLNKKA